MKTALIANGQISNLALLVPQIRTCKRIIAVDGGLRYCQELGITPQLIVGDFDSVDPELLASYKGVPRITLFRDKDKTDLETVLESEIREGTEQIVLFGALGGRMDHSIANLLLATRYPGKVRIETELETIFAIQGETKFSVSVGQTISLLPLNGPVRGITTTGLKWELNDATLDQNFISISNIALEKKISIAIREGILLCAIIKQ